MTSSPIHDYILALDKSLAAAQTTEHTHRPALNALFQALNTTITATNEPQHITAVGAPDFRIIKNKLAIGYVECKDIGSNLDEVVKTEQLKRYLNSFQNLLVTDYLEFRWYAKSELRLKKTIGTLLKNKIKPEKESLPEVEMLITAFLNNDPEPISSPKELAGHMARLSHIIREIIIKALGNELVTGSLHAQWQAFRENLIPELSVEQFADMYAQTIAYGLFAARCEADSGKDFTRQQAAYLIPKTNPFLRKLFNYIAGPELDESITWAVDDLSQILAWADMEAVLKDFGTSTGKTDPVVHFYETFLKEYDPKTREMRGVYYTPMPVVSYIVRSIDHILKTNFGKPQGLADPSVLILDPAVGTATFLYMVMQEIHEAIIKQGQTGTWDEYVAKKLLTRLFGFEILMAPYAIAHLKLGRLLKETGYQFQTDQRLGIYLTNTLEEAVKHADTMFSQWITEEANSAADIKKSKPIMVVLGNPPYSKSSANKGKHIEQLMERYKTAVRSERNIQPLSDDYIKFIRFAHDRIERTGYGVVGMITNNSYLSGLIHRGMREELMKSFSEIYVLNLHGSALLGEKIPEAGKDENVFDIKQGVAIVLCIENPQVHHHVGVRYAELWGQRDEKYRYLSTNEMSVTRWELLVPTEPDYFFVPKDVTLIEEYKKGYPVSEIFPVNSSGVKTHHDDFVIDFNESTLIERIKSFRERNLTDEEIQNHFQLRDWDVKAAREMLRKDPDWETQFTLCLYRPFDFRYIFYNTILIERPRSEVMHHMLKENIALVTTRIFQGYNFSGITVTQHLVEMKTAEATRGSYIFPLYLYPAEDQMQFGEGRHPNLNPEFIKAFSEKLKLGFIEDSKGNLQDTFGPEDIFDYAYSIFHSPNYRTRYVEFLKIDFPRLPLTSDQNLLKSLAEKGAVLVALHLMKSPLLNTLITRYPVGGEHEVEKVVYDDKTKRVAINKEEYFEGVPSEVWNFNIGGYQVWVV
jgi:predicted helicase